MDVLESHSGADTMPGRGQRALSHEALRALPFWVRMFRLFCTRRAVSRMIRR